MDASLAWNDALPPDPEPASAGSVKTTTGGDHTRPVVVAVIHGQIQAEMALEALREAGIPAVMQRNTVGSVYGLNSGQWGDVPLLVPAPLLVQAQTVLESMGLLPEGV